MSEIIYLFLKQMGFEHKVRFSFENIKIGFCSKDDDNKPVGIVLEAVNPAFIIDNNIYDLSSKDLYYNKSKVSIQCEVANKFIYKNFYRADYGLDLRDLFNYKIMKKYPYDFSSIIYSENSNEKLWSPTVTDEGLKMGDNLIVKNKHLAKIFINHKLIKELDEEGIFDDNAFVKFKNVST